MSNGNTSSKTKYPSMDSWSKTKFSHYGERKLGRLVDALALGGDEGRDKLR